MIQVEIIKNPSHQIIIFEKYCISQNNTSQIYTITTKKSDTTFILRDMLKVKN